MMHKNRIARACRNDWGGGKLERRAGSNGTNVSCKGSKTWWLEGTEGRHRAYVPHVLRIYHPLIGLLLSTWAPQYLPFHTSTKILRLIPSIHSIQTRISALFWSPSWQQCPKQHHYKTLIPVQPTSAVSKSSISSKLATNSCLILGKTTIRIYLSMFRLDMPDAMPSALHILQNCRSSASRFTATERTTWIRQLIHCWNLTR